MTYQKPISRLHLLDEIRGFCIICMVFYHAFYSMFEIFNISFAQKLFDFFMPVEPFFAATFIIISGIVCHFSRSNLKRGLQLLAVACIITLVTVIMTLFDFNEVIYFGILHLLAVSILLFCLIKPLILKIPPIAGMIVSALIFFATYNISYGHIGFGNFSFTLPGSLYTTDWLFPFGIYSATFYSSDYFPIFPWLFAFVFGNFLGVYAMQGKFPKCFEKLRFRPLSSVGRHSLIIYVLHQPVIFGLLMLVDYFIK